MTLATGHFRRRAAAWRAQHGVTLIELMIVVAVIGVLAALVYPSYSESVRKSRRVEAQSAMMELSHFLERYYTENGSYLTAQSVAPKLPFTQTPRDGSAAFYNVSVQGASSDTFTLRAEPAGGQAGDRCGTLTLTSAGARGAAASNCWQR